MNDKEENQVQERETRIKKNIYIYRDDKDDTIIKKRKKREKKVRKTLLMTEGTASDRRIRESHAVKNQLLLFRIFPTPRQFRLALKLQ